MSKTDLPKLDYLIKQELLVWFLIVSASLKILFSSALFRYVVRAELVSSPIGKYIWLFQQNRRSTTMTPA